MLFIFYQFVSFLRRHNHPFIFIYFLCIPHTALWWFLFIECIITYLLTLMIDYKQAMCWETFVQKCPLPPLDQFKTNLWECDLNTLERSKRRHGSESPTGDVEQLSWKPSEESYRYPWSFFWLVAWSLQSEWHSDCGAHKVKDAFQHFCLLQCCWQRWHPEGTWTGKRHARVQTYSSNP